MNNIKGDSPRFLTIYMICGDCPIPIQKIIILFKFYTIYCTTIKYLRY